MIIIIIFWVFIRLGKGKVEEKIVRWMVGRVKGERWGGSFWERWEGSLEGEECVGCFEREGWEWWIGTEVWKKEWSMENKQSSQTGVFKFLVQRCDWRHFLRDVIKEN